MSTPARIVAPAHPWQRTARTVFAAIVGAAAMADLVYEAATKHDPATATGWAATGLGIAAAVTRVLATPQVEAFLRRFLPWLSAGDVQANRVLAQLDPAGPHPVVAGEAAPQPTGSLLVEEDTIAEITPRG